MKFKQRDPVTKNVLVCAAMRNEGPFIVEWVSWYRMLGFQVLVVTNDCTDRSVELLETLADAGWLTHQGHTPKGRQRPKRSAYNTMRNHPLIEKAEWVLVCDVDEFLVLHQAGSIQDYLSAFDPAPLGIGFHWKAFGTSGLKIWQDRLVHRTFTQAAETRDPANTSFKSMFRRPLDYQKFGDHSPKLYSGPWGIANHVWVDCEGRRLGRFKPDEAPQKATATDRVCHSLAQMNHYIIRTDENFAMKKGTASASAGIDRYTESFYQKFNRNEADDQSALRFRVQFDRVYAKAMAIPNVRKLHNLCCADYLERLANSRGEAAEDDPRWQHHMKASAL